uniref:UDP-glucose ceramide glucosyltransferase-like 1 n=1 Tax=Scleropages formosus TaxID=113540 RepID=A0A8C9VL63_SCLFO
HIDRMRILTVFLVWVSVVHAGTDSKAVTTSLTAKWPSTPLLLEARYVAHPPKHAFTLLEHSFSYKHAGSDQFYYELVVERASQLLSPVQLNMLRFALSLRAYSPTVHAFQQIAFNEPPPTGCKAFYSVHGVTSCNTESLKALLETALERPKPYLFKGDHTFPSSAPNSPVVILYAKIGSKDFPRFHQLMVSKANKGEITYVLRHFLSVSIAVTSKCADLNATVIGESDSVDEVQGFLFGKLKTLYPELKDQLRELRKHLVESTNEMAPLKVWQMQDLSFQTAARILAAPPTDALAVMRDLSQNFPTKARCLVNSEIRKEIEENQKYFKGTLGLQPGDSALFINGLHIDLDLQDIFSVFDTLRNEARVMEGLRNLLNDMPFIHDMLSLSLQPLDSDYAVDIRSPAIYWINNLETDSRYASWPSNVQELLRPTFPGVIRQIRKNFHNFVIIVDPTHQNTAELLSVAEMFLSNNIPLRIGLVFVVSDNEEVDGMDDAGVALLRAFNYIADEVDNQQAFDAVISMFNIVPRGESLKVEHVTNVLEKRYPYVEIQGEYLLPSQEGRAYYEQTGVGPLPVVLYNGMPYQRDQLEPDELETITMHKILETTSFFQRAIYLGELGSDQDVVDFIMDQPNVVPRINSRILSTNNHFIDDYARFLFLDTRGKNTAVANSMNYMTKKDDGIIRPVTFWVVGDFDQPTGRQLLYDAIKHMKTSNNVRLGMINNPSEGVSNITSRIARAIWAAMQTQTANNAKNLITKLCKEETAAALASGVDIAEFAVGVRAQCGGFLMKGKRMCGRKGQERSGDYNEKHLETYSGVTFKEDAETRLSAMFYLLPSCVLGPYRASDLVMKVDALLSSQPKGEARVKYTFFEDRYRSVSSGCEAGCFVIFLRISTFCLFSFYRYVLEPEISFTSDGSLAPGPVATFLDMPHSPLFTLNLNTPESWMVESVRTRYDLDNIYLEEVDSVVAAEYELEYLLLEGHCFDVTTGQPPRGLQFTLGTASDPLIVDTIVMANLGYFQLKANPGSWILKLRKGRSDDIYKIYSHEGTDSLPEADDLIVVLNNFKSKIIKVKVQKKPEKLNEELLSDGTEEEDSGLWSSLKRTFTGAEKVEDNKVEKDDVINIFSVASGHLYERFLRIMMLSVLKHTKTPVKFWFLKNYLSPTFKEFIPYMAEEYGFQYELVQYKWPRWLHQQTEKQRIIWGYKILFLDVLFPLAVDKILFVDADQIVRTDLKELRDFDLEGAPYGYTPFCESRREMDGYRFWKSGYWASHLAGRKYHISALYVVDLKKFRKIAAGDRLRGQYQGLSQDPNSLSNLDQDLPNNMIHQVPIKSLPQEWLWCETWCDDSSKKKAKTIDLCNNPQTKEPKLQAAVRIVAEWSEYDQELKRIYNKFLEEKERGSTADSSKISQGSKTGRFAPVTSTSQ